MSDPTENTPVDKEGNVIDVRPYYDIQAPGRMVNGGGHPAPFAAMPPHIAMALVKASRECGAAAKTGHGTEDRNGYEKDFSFATIDDVLEASSKALGDAGLFVYPMCVHYDVVQREVNHVVSLWADYSFQFMLVWADEGKQLSATWICPHDIRHISLPYEGGKTEGMAQSYALKHFLRGILRIKTGEKDAESVRVPKGEVSPQEARQRQRALEQANVGVAPMPASAGERPKRGRPPLPRFPFDFGRSGDPGNNGYEQVTADECLALFDRIVKPLSLEKRKNWQEVNRIGLEQLCGAAKNAWLQVMRELEATE